MNGIKIEGIVLILLIKKNEARTYINNVDEAMLSDTCKKKLNLNRLSLNYQIFIIHQKLNKMVNYYFLQLGQALQNMPYTNTLDK